MRTLFLGIDSGTQSTKALVVDAKSGKVLGAASAAYDLIGGLPPGAKEQHPRDWIVATRKSIQAALKQAKARAKEVVAIGVSGQQHGFVPLDKADNVKVFAQDLPKAFHFTGKTCICLQPEVLKPSCRKTLLWWFSLSLRELAAGRH